MTPHSQRLVEVEESLPSKIPVRILRSLIKKVIKCQEWSELASVDVKRFQTFLLKPIWCVDFSEIRVFLERNEQQPSALHLIDLLATRQERFKENLIILPGTVFELLAFLDNLIQKSTYSHSGYYRSLTNEIKEKINSANTPEKKGEMILEFISKHAGRSIDDAISKLKQSEPAVLRLQSLIRSDNVKFFHEEYKDEIKSLQWYPSFFANVYNYLQTKRDKLQINNYNDALNMSICNSLNQKYRKRGRYFTYVTRDRRCMEASKHYPWQDDPINKLDPSQRVPICRDPYSVFLFLGDLKESNDSEELFKSCRKFVDELISLPEYIQAIQQEESDEERYPIIRFDNEKDQYKNLSKTLENLLNRYGILLYKAIEQTDSLEETLLNNPIKSLKIGEFPKRELLVGTRSLEHLTTALGLIYSDVTSRELQANQAVKDLLHRSEKISAINISLQYDDKFDSYAYILGSTSAREKAICIIEAFNKNSSSFYYSAWWNSIVDISVFVDVVNFFWSSIRQNRNEDLPTDEEKAFETGVTLVNQVVIDEQIKEEIITETHPDLIPLTDDDLLKQYLEKYHLSAIRLNTRAGDIWLNFTTNHGTVPRMGIVSHIWDPVLLSQMITFTSKHYISVVDLEEKLKEIKL